MLLSLLYTSRTPLEVAVRVSTKTKSPTSRRALFRQTRLLFFFHHLAPLGLGGGDDLLLLQRWNEIVVVHLHREAAAALRHRGQVGAVGQHFGHGHDSLHNRLAGLVVHALDASAPAVQVTHD